MRKLILCILLAIPTLSFADTCTLQNGEVVLDCEKILSLCRKNLNDAEISLVSVGQFLNERVQMLREKTQLLDRKIKTIKTLRKRLRK